MNLPALALAAILVALGGGVTFGEYRNVRHALEAEAWPTAEAVVTVAQYRRARRMERFEYRYTVDGRSFEGHRGEFLPMPYRPERERYSTGDTITVRYDPEAPDRAVVRPGVDPLAAALNFLPGMAVLAAGLGLGALGVRD